MKIVQQSLMNNPLGLIGAVYALKNGCHCAWWAGDQQYSVLEFDYGLSIKIRKQIKSENQLSKDILEIVNHCMPKETYKIERDGDFIRIKKLKKE